MDRTKVLGAGMLVLAIATAACASEADDVTAARDPSVRTTEPADDSAEAAAYEPEVTEPPATTTTTVPTTTTTQPPAPAMVESGTYVVPDQFAPGIYRVEGYWARLDDNQEIIDNDIVDSGLTLMNVAPTDAYVEISGAAIALVDLPSVDPIAEGWTDGTYLVGTDPRRPLQRHRRGAQRLLRPARRHLEIIDNNLSEGNVIAVVDPGDWAFS